MATVKELDYMGSDMAPEFIYNQGLYYPSDDSYYGFYPAGTESPGEWDDHHGFLCGDGQDIYYTVTDSQAESQPYIYYTPSYVDTQSPYNPYNPYIPGAVLGADTRFIGTQQFSIYPNSYELSASSPAYIPVIAQPGSDSVINGSSDPSFINIGMPVTGHRPDSALTHYTPLLVSSNAAATSQMTALRNPIPETFKTSPYQASSKISNGSSVRPAETKQSLTNRAVTAGSAHLTQGTDHLSNGGVSSVHSPLGLSMPASNGFSALQSSIGGWNSVDNYKLRFQYNRTSNGKTSPDILGDQNRFPRTTVSKDSTSSITHTTKGGNSDMSRNITIYADHYNRDDFPVDYPVAKFFVIKSYTEDDVHKSIKYNVWSSTPNGNRKLDCAYEDAQRISIGRPRNCPIFLFFSVNTSGNFCGVAEMIGRVDFHKNMDFWQQDKWIGSFPVRWHIIKDVPNICLRHILLENNEFIPVTSSRDTQEVTYVPGIEILKIFKHTSLVSSILDDFMYYEEHERIMRERRSRLIGRNHPNSSFCSVFVPSIVPNGSVTQPPQACPKQWNVKADSFTRKTEKQTGIPFDKFLKSYIKEASGKVEESPKEVGRQEDNTVEQSSEPGIEHPHDKVDQTLEVEGNLTHAVAGQPARAANLIEHEFTVHHLSEPNGIKASGVVDQPPEADGERSKGTFVQSLEDKASELNHAVDQSFKVNRKQSNGTANIPPIVVNEQPNTLFSQHSKANHDSGEVITSGSNAHSSVEDKNAGSSKVLKTRKVRSRNKQVTPKMVSNDSNVEKDVGPDSIDLSSVSSVEKSDPLSIDSKVVEASCSNLSTDVIITVGTMPIKIDRENESVSRKFSSRLIPVDEKGRKVKPQGVFSKN